MPAQPPHPPPERLLAFAQGKLPEADSAALEEHLATCAACAQALQLPPDDTLVRLARESETVAPLPAPPPTEGVALPATTPPQGPGTPDAPAAAATGPLPAPALPPVGPPELSGHP